MHYCLKRLWIKNWLWMAIRLKMSCRLVLVIRYWKYAIVGGYLVWFRRENYLHWAKSCVLAQIYWIVYDIIAFLDVKVDSILIALLMSDNRMTLVSSAANAFWMIYLVVMSVVIELRLRDLTVFGRWLTFCSFVVNYKLPSILMLHTVVTRFYFLKKKID